MACCTHVPGQVLWRSLLAVEYERLLCICSLPAYRKQEDADEWRLNTDPHPSDTAHARIGGHVAVEHRIGLDETTAIGLTWFRQEQADVVSLLQVSLRLIIALRARNAK